MMGKVGLWWHSGVAAVRSECGVLTANFVVCRYSSSDSFMASNNFLPNSETGFFLPNLS